MSYSNDRNKIDVDKTMNAMKQIVDVLRALDKKERIRALEAAQAILRDDGSAE